MQYLFLYLSIGALIFLILFKKLFNKDYKWIETIEMHFKYEDSFAELGTETVVIMTFILFVFTYPVLIPYVLMNRKIK